MKLTIKGILCEHNIWLNFFLYKDTFVKYKITFELNKIEKTIKEKEKFKNSSKKKVIRTPAYKIIYKNVW